MAKKNLAHRSASLTYGLVVLVFLGLTFNYRTGVICILLCLAVGISNIFSFNLLILWAVLCMCVSLLVFPSNTCSQFHSFSGLVLIFVEIPLLLRICPTSAKFDAFIRRFTTNYMRAAIYGVMSIVQWLSLIKSASSLIAAAVLLLIAATFYAIAGFKDQEFVGSKTLGGQGVAQMIV